MRGRESIMKSRGTSLKAMLRKNMMVQHSICLQITDVDHNNDNDTHTVLLLLNIYLSEQDERTRETTEQLRQFHYDGMDPSQ